jgi:hypothetical protein
MVGSVLRWRRKEDPVLKRVLRLLPMACLATGMMWAADNSFLGEWKLVPSKSRMPDEMKVESKGGNTYAFDFGGGSETIVVDGPDQPGRGGTMLSVKADGPYFWTVERKKNGKLLLRGTWKLSEDGNMLEDLYREFESDGSTLSMDYIYRRSGVGSGFAADWQSIRETMNSPYFLVVKAYQRDGLSFISPMEQERKNVKFDGKDYPNEGPNTDTGSTSSIRQVNEHTLEITDKANGKLKATEQIELSADLKTLTITMHIAGKDKPNVMVFERQ